MRKAINKRHNRGCQQSNRGLQKKIEVVMQLGGKCSICNYNKNLTSLTFHHLKPEEKSFPIDLRAFANRKHKLLMEEINKCQLVCRNCHGEIEHPQFNNWGRFLK